jgi:hypothetical protein
MVFFIFTLLLMFSLSGVLYLMVRALPRVEDAAIVSGDEHRGFLDRWARSQLPEKFDRWFNGFLLKFLRKFKVFILKLDNIVSTHLRKIHHEKNGKKTIDFKEISEQNKED